MYESVLDLGSSRSVLEERKRTLRGMGRTNIYKRQEPEIRQFPPPSSKVYSLSPPALPPTPQISQLFYKMQNRKSNLRPPEPPQNSKGPRTNQTPQIRPDPPLTPPETLVHAPPLSASGPRWWDEKNRPLHCPASPAPHALPSPMPCSALFSWSLATWTLALGRFVGRGT